MATRDIVVIGASAGGITALKRLFAPLPADLPAAIFVVLHLGSRAGSQLSAIFSKAGPLPAEFAEDDAPYRRGRIYLAPPDRHLLLRAERTHLRRGARENLSRPAIDPLFRSAGVDAGSRVIGVVLSGSLGDGSAGLRAIKQCGGLALVQDPGEAEFPEMPKNAIAWAAPDLVAPVAELADAIVRRVAEPAPSGRECPEVVRLETEFAFSTQENHMHEQPGKRSVFSCPECQGAIWEIREGGLVRYRCHVGHAYTDETILDANGDVLEKALWTALRILEERHELVRSLAERAEAGAHDLSAERFRERAQEYENEAALIRGLLRQGVAGQTSRPAKRRAAAQ